MEEIFHKSSLYLSSVVFINPAFT